MPLPKAVRGEFESHSHTLMSGKYATIGILTIALIAATISWTFRYTATHRAAKFWGPEATRLIRDAPQIHMIRYEPRDATGSTVVVTNTSPRDVSSARGITHLRNALIEDDSYGWPVPKTPPDVSWPHALEFRNASDKSWGTLTISFSPDFKWAAEVGSDGRPQRYISTQPIAEGLAEMFAEFAADPDQTSR